MVDTPVKKSFLRHLRDGLQWTLDIVLIVFIAIFKGLDILLQHLITELSKF